MDWRAELADPIRTDVLEEMGSGMTVEVTETSTRTASGKKVPAQVSTYTGAAVMGGYATEAEESDSNSVKAGDTKFVAQFDDGAFEPSEKLDEKIVFGGRRYTVTGARRVNPDGTVDVVWVVYARRVN